MMQDMFSEHKQTALNKEGFIVSSVILSVV